MSLHRYGYVTTNTILLWHDVDKDLILEQKFTFKQHEKLTYLEVMLVSIVYLVLSQYRYGYVATVNFLIGFYVDKDRSLA